MKKLAVFLILTLCSALPADVSTTTTKVTYSANGSATTFDFSFPIVSTSDLTVILRVTSTGVESTLTESTDYSLSTTNNDYTNGGTVTTVATYASGNTLTLIRETPQTQDTVLQDAGLLRVAALESGLDKLTLLVQQLQEQLDRAMIIPKSEELDMSLASTVDRANQFLVFSATGQPTVSSSGFTSDDYVVSTYMESVLDDTSEGVFKATVNLEIGTDVQAYDAELAAIATLTSAANKLPMFSGSGTATFLDTSAELLAVLSDETGTGVAVFGTSPTLGTPTLTSPVLNTGLSGTAFLDEDNMASDSATKAASQQSIKAYVDTEIVSNTLNIRTGNITVSDFDEGDSPVEATWTNLDLSSVSSSDATALLIFLRIKDAAASKVLMFRKDETTSDSPGAIAGIISQAANIPTFETIVVGCASGIVEYNLTAGTDEFDVTVTGWWE